MDGNHRDTPLGLILASIPIQALLVAGVVAGFASATHSQTVPVQYGQPGISCVADGPGYGDGTLTCAGYGYPGMPPGQPVAKVPCCDTSAP
jgi:hypothetical protein